MSQTVPDAMSKTLMGHPVGLFILFFTEMWERFSYYGMRALLVLYLVSELSEGGLGWEQKEAGFLYGWYTMLVYITPVIGGILADKIFGYRKAIVIGGVLMTLGHAALAFEALPMFYFGLFLLIVGNGFFKPNISSIVGQLYAGNEGKQDGGYTIFYQGINVGAFLGTLICGYLGESIGWHYGFGAAGIFMAIGLLQFWISQKIFGNIGLAPKDMIETPDGDAVSVAMESDPDLLDAVDSKKPGKLDQSPKAVRGRLIVIFILAFFSIFFWAAFEQAGSSMNIFALNYTDRSLAPESVGIFKVISLIFNVLPVLILTGLFIGMLMKIGKNYLWAMMAMALSIIMLWITVSFIMYDQFSQEDPVIPASWFQMFNALFIFTLAPVFSKLWSGLSKTKYDPIGPIKFALGLILLGIGFIPMVIGSSDIPIGADSYNASISFLILAYFIHTMGELCLSPVGLSYVKKLSPAKYLGIMFGIWFLASALGNMAAGTMSAFMEDIAKTTSMADFFKIFVYAPIIAGVVLIAISPVLKKMMHGVK